MANTGGEIIYRRAALWNKHEESSWGATLTSSLIHLLEYDMALSALFPALYVSIILSHFCDLLGKR